MYGNTFHRHPYAAYAQPLPPAVKNLLIVTIFCFVLQLLLGRPFNVIFGLMPALAISHFYIWQFATYLFLHAGLWHIFFNMLVLWMFGREVEQVLGTRRFTFYYFMCGIGAALCSIPFYSPHTLIIGASGAIFGVMVAFAMLFPDRVITLLLFFILPVSMKAKHLVMILAGVELLTVLANVQGDFIAHFAHLGGALFGFLYMSYFKHPGSFSFVNFPKKHRRPDSVGSGPDVSSDFRERVDIILDKIYRHGFSSLTEEEKEILRKAKDNY
jgi:membrane associated rhomboid family serine protease